MQVQAFSGCSSNSSPSDGSPARHASGQAGARGRAGTDALGGPEASNGSQSDSDLGSLPSLPMGRSMSRHQESQGQQVSTAESQPALHETDELAALSMPAPTTPGGITPSGGDGTPGAGTSPAGTAKDTDDGVGSRFEKAMQERLALAAKQRQSQNVTPPSQTAAAHDSVSEIGDADEDEMEIYGHQSMGSDNGSDVWG